LFTCSGSELGGTSMIVLLGLCSAKDRSRKRFVRSVSAARLKVRAQQGACRTSQLTPHRTSIILGIPTVIKLSGCPLPPAESSQHEQTHYEHPSAFAVFPGVVHA